MANRVLWSAVALASLIYTSGCCCGPCGDCCGGCGMDLGGRYNDCGGCPGSAGQTFCGRGCGEKYWGEWNAPRCDSCDCDGNFTGQCCYGPFSWIDDCWLSLWGCTHCNSCNSCCDSGCHGGGNMGECCNNSLFGGGWGGRFNYNAGMPHGGCSSCGHAHGGYVDGQVIESQSPTPAGKKAAPMKETEPMPEPPQPSSTSYRPSRQSVVTVAPASARTKVSATRPTTSNQVRQVQYQNSQPATSTRTAPLPQRATMEKSPLNRVPQSAADFDLPPGAQIIKIEDN